MTLPMPPRFVRILFASLLFLGAIGTIVQAEPAGLILPADPSEPVILDEDLKTGQDPNALFQVFVGEPSECCDGRRPISGSYTMVAEGLAFTPLFGFDAGQSYVVHTVTGTTSKLTEFALPVDKGDVVASVVTSIFPSGKDLPENTLRFYIHFSQPMKPHVSSDYIHLINSERQIDDAAFMSFKQELWSADRKRLTILMDPGRIKRGIAQNETLGPAFEQGGHYQIVVEEGWPTASGETSLARFEKEFGVSAPLRDLPDVAEWAIDAPRTGSTEALKIAFDRPFDASLLKSDIQVQDSSGAHIDGTVTIGSGEKSWAFVPSKAWPLGEVTLFVKPTLEDISGNNFNELLDHEVGTETKSAESIIRTVHLARQ